MWVCFVVVNNNCLICFLIGVNYGDFIIGKNLLVCKRLGGVNFVCLIDWMIFDSIFEIVFKVCYIFVVELKCFIKMF